MSRLPSPSSRYAACKAIGRFVHCQLRRPTAGIWALFATLVFAITTLSLTVSMTHSVRDALRQSVEQTIGGDISLRLFHRPPTDAELGFLETFGIVGVSAEQRVMIHPKPHQAGILSELKAVDRTYPLFGDVKLSRPGPVSAILANDDDDHAGGNKTCPGQLLIRIFLIKADFRSAMSFISAISNTVFAQGCWPNRNDSSGCFHWDRALSYRLMIIERTPCYLQTNRFTGIAD